MLSGERWFVKMCQLPDERIERVEREIHKMISLLKKDSMLRKAYCDVDFYMFASRIREFYAYRNDVVVAEELFEKY
jgi:hypothetical protein